MIYVLMLISASRAHPHLNWKLTILLVGVLAWFNFAWGHIRSFLWTCLQTRCGDLGF